jgi:hypothetical protein
MWMCKASLKQVYKTSMYLARNDFWLIENEFKMWCLYRLIVVWYIFTVIWSDRLCGLVIRAPGYRSRGPGSIPVSTRFFWEVLGLKRGPLSLVSAIEELFDRNGIDSGLQSREYGRRDLSAKMLALTSPTSGAHSVDIVCSRTQATEFILVLVILVCFTS